MTRCLHRTRRTHTSSLRAVLIFALLFFAASSARAQRYVLVEPVESHVGVYFAGGLAVSLQLLAGADGALGGQGNLRIGYSFSRGFQLYLEGIFSGSSHTYAGAVTATDVMVGLRYFFYANRSVGVYGRGGLGLGIVTLGNAIQNTDGTFSGGTNYGIAETLAFGMEFRLGGKWALSPELFYRRTDETSEVRIDTLGLGFLINFN